MGYAKIIEANLCKILSFKSYESSVPGATLPGRNLLGAKIAKYRIPAGNGRLYFVNFWVSFLGFTGGDALD